MPKLSESILASRAEVEKRQLDALNLLLASIGENRFQTDRLRGHWTGGEISSLDQFTSTFPLTTKADLVADHDANPPYGSNLSEPLTAYTRFCQTSGSTGRPLRWLDTSESWQWMLENWKHVYRGAGAGQGDRIYFAFSFGPFLGFWTAFDAAQQLGCLCIPGGGLSSVGRLQAIVDNSATILCCTPTYALHLAETAKAQGIDLSVASVRTIIVAGEPGGSLPAIRQRISAAWCGARVFDHHGMTEVGPVTYESPTTPGNLRVIPDSFIAEIVDPASLNPVQEGEMGELILTTLGRTACPLLRYRTGDLVVAETETPPDDFAGLELRGGILGRADDMVVVRGVNIYPAAVDSVLRRIPEIAEYRVEVFNRNAMAELKVTIEPLGECESQGSDIAKRAARELKSAFSLRIDVGLAKPGELPRFEMKARRWVNS